MFFLKSSGYELLINDFENKSKRGEGKIDGGKQVY